MAVVACPRPDTLAAFARGDLPPHDLSAVAEHVGVCAACCAALKGVPDDPLAALARAAIAAPNGPTSVIIPAALVNHPRYRILGELGAGGMGVVYKAQDLIMDRVVALKVMASNLTAKASAVERFRKEVRAAAKLDHQNIVTAHDAGEAGGFHFLVMAFVEGVSLDRLVTKKGPLAVPLACSFARQAALGLQHAADKGMVHRDIKPQNLMVTRKGQVKILDFGLARFARADEENAPVGKVPFGAGKAPAEGLTNPNLLMGTPDYLSPEQAKNSHDVDARSDIYSLGCTLYFLLTGRQPFAHAESLIDKLIAHTQEEPPAVRSLRPEVPDGLAEVLAKMMAKNPADRYQSASEAAAALLPYTRADAVKEAAEVLDAVVVAPAPVLMAMAVITPAPVHPLAFDTAPVADGPTAFESSRPKKKKKKKAGWWKRRKWPILGGAAAFALLIGVVLAINSGKKKTEPPVDPGTSAKTGTPPDPQRNPAGQGDKGKGAVTNPWITPGKTVLYVLPSDGVWLPDYLPVRERLEQRGVKVVTASADGGEAKPHQEGQGSPVRIDVKLAQATPGDYDAVVFCGYKWEEYTGPNPKSSAAGNLIKQTLQAGKPVGAICVGQGVLMAHGVLRDREAAYCKQLADARPFQVPSRTSGIKWKYEGVVTDGKIITAAGPEDAVKFADALLTALMNSK